MNLEEFVIKKLKVSAKSKISTLILYNEKF